VTQGPSHQETPEQATTPPAPPSGRRSVVTGLVTASVLVIVGGVLFAAGVFDGDGAPVAADPAATSAPAVSSMPEEIPGETVGTPENPFRPGDSFTFFDDWTFTVGETDTDAWPALAGYYQEHFPDRLSRYEPDPGAVYVTAPLVVTHSGSAASRRHLNTALHHVRVDGTETYVNGCNLTGRNFKSFPASALKSEPTVEGSLCVEIPAEAVPGGQWWIYLSYYDPATGTELDQQLFYTAE